MPFGENIHSPIKAVRHADLDRDDSDSAFRSTCPECNGTGILLVQRNQQTFKLSRIDRCIRCGQAFWYTDETINGEVPEGPREPPGAKMDTPLVDAIMQKVGQCLDETHADLLDEVRRFLTQDEMPQQYQNRGEWGAGLSYRAGAHFEPTNPEAFEGANVLLTAIAVRNEEYGVPFTSEEARQAAYQRLHDCFPTAWDRILNDG